MKEAIIIEQKAAVVSPIKMLSEQRGGYQYFHYPGLKRGMKLYQFDLTNNLVSPVDILGELNVHGRRMLRFDHVHGRLYGPAINAENAYKKLSKLADELQTKVQNARAAQGISNG